MVSGVRGAHWWLLLGDRGGGSCRVGRRSGIAAAVGACGLVVEEVEATAKAEGVVVLVVVDLTLSLSPELVGVLRDGGPSRWRSRVGKEGVWLHFAELSGSEACPSVGKRESTMPPFIYGDCNPVKHRSSTVPSLSRFHHMSGEVMQSGGRRGERISLSVELFGNRTYEP